MQATRQTTCSEVMIPGACGHGRSLIQGPTHQGFDRLVRGAIRVRYRGQEKKSGLGRHVAEVTHCSGVMADGVNTSLTLQTVVAESYAVEGRVIHLAVPPS